MSACGCIGGTTGTTTFTPKEPCEQAVDAKPVAEFMETTDEQILDLSTSVEYGAETKIFLPPGSTNYGDPNRLVGATPIRTDGNSGTFSPQFTWNSSQGFTINISHGHSNGGAPSPADILMAHNFVNNYYLRAAGPAAVNFFKENFTITTVTESGTYVVKVSDWDALEDLHSAYYADVQAGKQAWIEEAIDYDNNNGGGISDSEKTTYSSLKLYGDAVTILKADKGTTDFKPLKLNNNNRVSETNCP